MPILKALVFDAYGTIFDTQSVLPACERLAPGKGSELSQLWRAKQLEYSWLRSLMGTYEDFAKVTSSALAYSCARLGIGTTLADRRKLMSVYLHLAPFPDVAATLPKLKQFRLSILSNGSPSMLTPLVRNAGMAKVFEHVMSADEVNVFKPSPRVYRLAVKTLKLKPRDIGFISSNPFDIAGAKATGFRVLWLNRTGALLDELGQTPDAVLKSFADLPKALPTLL